MRIEDQLRLKKLIAAIQELTPNAAESLRLDLLEMHAARHPGRPLPARLDSLRSWSATRNKLSEGPNSDTEWLSRYFSTTKDKNLLLERIGHHAKLTEAATRDHG